MIHHGDCLEVMAGMEPESVDAVVTDPPYGLEFMGKAWDAPWRKGSGVGEHNAGFADMDGLSDQRAGHEGGTWFGSRAGTAPNYLGSTNPTCRNCGGTQNGNDRKSRRRCRCDSPSFPNTIQPRQVAYQEWCQAWAEAAYRVAKPSAYLLAFGGTRTVHRMTCAIEDAGWIIRDMLVWAYASGFPKSKASLKPAWEPIVMARKPGPLRMLAIDECRIEAPEGSVVKMAHSETGAARGMGGGLKGGNRVEPQTLGRWPANVILTDPIFDGGWDGVVGGSQSGILTACPTCGAPPAGLSSTAGGPIDGSTALWSALPPQSERTTFARSAVSEPTKAASSTAQSDAPTWADGLGESMENVATRTELPVSLPESSVSGSATASGLWPDSMSPSVQPARSADRQRRSVATTTTTNGPWTCEHSARDATTASTPASTGGYSRFFLLSKADRADREPVLGGPTKVRAILGQGIGGADNLGVARANSHPTVKPVDLMRHLVRLVTPTGGTVLDPFLGSGSTGLAAEMEGFEWVGIEREAEYVAIAEARLNGTQRGMAL